MTILYCPSCDTSTECNLNGQQPKERIVFYKDPVISSYIRKRSCEKCGNKFITHEISELSLENLIKNFSSEHLLDNTKEIEKRGLVLRMLSEAIENALNTLIEQEQKLLRMRFGIGTIKALTNLEICSQTNITLNNIEKTQEHALRKLRHPSRSQGFIKFTEPKYKREINIESPEALFIAAIFRDDAIFID